ncbi:unnamed protein product [Soboliphyme baturini]|uniref:Ovule protein n=1 Tax=Soboliphyme baturini TaxID=241478 RepID=A0A183J253_9BILA|nr:unnamed protein product [Soboliphyme baturini]
MRFLLNQVILGEPLSKKKFCTTSNAFDKERWFPLFHNDNDDDDDLQLNEGSGEPEIALKNKNEQLSAESYMTSDVLRKQDMYEVWAKEEIGADVLNGSRSETVSPRQYLYGQSSAIASSTL